MKKELTKAIHSTQFKKSNYLSLIVIITIAIVVVINLLVTKLPTSVKNLDISQNHLYTIGDVTKSVLEGLEHDVELIVVAEEGTVDSRIENFVNLYQAASDHVTVTYKDPALFPSVLTAYDIEADTIVVSCEDTGKTETILFSDIIQFDQTYYYYYGTYIETAFDGEGQITSAIDYVANENDKTIYLLSGHGEIEFADSVEEKISRSNIDLDTWNLLTDGELPEDCSMLIINQALSDINEQELASVKAYLSSGGNVMVILSAKAEETPNLAALMSEYGIGTAGGYVGDQSRYNAYDQSYFSSFPEYSTGSITGSMNDDSELTLIQNGLALTATEVENVTLDKFLVTSSYGVYYSEKNESMVSGEFNYAIAATKSEESDAEGNALTSSMTVYGCSSIIDSELLRYYASVHNLDVFMNSITAYFDDVENISIDAVSLEITYNTIKNAGFYSMLFIAVIPAALIVLGLVRWLQRRKL